MTQPDNQTIGFDTAALRSQIPGLEAGLAHFDGPGGTQTPASVADAVAEVLKASISNRGDVTPAELYADTVVVEARRAMADLLDIAPEGIVFGRSMTQLTFDFSRTILREMGPGDEVVVSRIEHDANIRPWVLAAKSVGASVRWIDFDKETADLTVEHVEKALTSRTRLVAITGSSNMLGTRPDLVAIRQAVHSTGAKLFVDGVALTPHASVSVREIGADFYACSPYKFFGTHCGVLAAEPEILEHLYPDKLLPATDDVPERFEYGTLPYELLAGVTAAVDFIADIAAPPGLTRRERLIHSMNTVEHYEDRVVQQLDEQLRAIPGLMLHGHPAHRTPILLFSIDGHSGQEVSERLASRGVAVLASNFYALEACRFMGLGDDGAVRIGLAPYTDESDVGRLVDALDEIARS
ncbi:cysteine desulfurase-like protein [Rhodococcus koreensis]